MPPTEPARRRPTHRLHLLFGAGCLRVAWHAGRAEAFRRTLEAVEAAADGGPRPDVGLLRAERPDGDAVPWDAAEALRFAGYAPHAVGYHGAAGAAARVAAYIRRAAPAAGPLLDRLHADVLAAPALEEFRPGWRSAGAVALADGMYAARDFTGMPALADELQDAGCDEPRVLDHCRDPAGVHARGCWVVDLVLGKG